MLPVASNQFLSGQSTITGCVQISKDLLQLHRIVHVQEVLNKVAQSGLLGLVLARECAKVVQGASHVLASLIHLDRVGFFFEAARLFEPGVYESFCGRDSLVLLAEHSGDQVLYLVRDLRPLWVIKVELTDLDLLNNLLIRASIEGRPSTEQDVENDSDGPNVTLFAVGTLDNLRSHVVRGSKHSMHGVLVIDSPGGAKIDELDNGVLLVLEVNILRLYVPMHDRLLVQVVHGRDQLANDVCGFHLVESAVINDALVQGATVHHLIHEVDLLLVFVHFDDLADVGVVKALKELNLVKKLATLTELEIFLPNNFDSSRDARDSMDTSAHAAESSLTNDLMQVVVILNIVLVTQVELFWVQLNAMALIR